MHYGGKYDWMGGILHETRPLILPQKDFICFSSLLVDALMAYFQGHTAPSKWLCPRNK
jgi:hypothetical protein